MKHQDFILRITSGPGGLRVQALTPIGEGEGPFLLPPDLPTLSEVLGLRRPDRELASRLRAEDPQLSAAQLGTRLFEALFPLPIRQMLDESLGRIGGGKSLRLCLVFATELAALYELPWELLYRPDTFLALSRRIHLIRTLDLPPLERTVSPVAPHYILVVMGDVTEYELDLQLEADLIMRAFPSQSYELVFLANPDRPTLREALRSQPFEVVHFSGHSHIAWETGKSVLSFAGRDSGITGDELAEDLRSLPDLGLVVLNARESIGVALVLVRAGVPAVVAMQANVEDRKAVVFSDALYRLLGAGDPLEMAVSAARHALHQESPAATDWALPVLIERRMAVASAEKTVERRKWKLDRSVPEAVGRGLAATQALLRRSIEILRRGGRRPARPVTTNRFDLLPAWFGVALGLAVGGAAAVALFQGPPAVAVIGFFVLLVLAVWMVGSAQPVEAPEASPQLSAAPAERAEPAPKEPLLAEPAGWRTPEFVWPARQRRGGGHREDAEMDIGRRIVGSLLDVGLKIYGMAAAVSVALSDEETVGGKVHDALAAVPNLMERYRQAKYVIDNADEIQATLEYAHRHAPDPRQLEAAVQKTYESLARAETMFGEVRQAQEALANLSLANAFDVIGQAITHLGSALDAMPDLPSIAHLADAAHGVTPVLAALNNLDSDFSLYTGLLCVADNFARGEIASTFSVMAGAFGIAFVLGLGAGFWGRRGRPGLLVRTLHGWGAWVFRSWYVDHLEAALGRNLYTVARERIRRDIIADPQAALDPEAYRELARHFERRFREDAVVGRA